MKLLFSSLLLAFAAAEQQDRGLQQQYSNAGDLAARWDMSEPTINYAPDEDKFTFTFMVASSDNYNEGLYNSFWNPACMPAEAGVVGVDINPPLIQSVTDSTVLPELTMTDIGEGVMKPVMEFKIDPAGFSTGGLTDTYTTTTGTAIIEFCIRSGLGYTTDPSVVDYTEVNFIETLVQVSYDMAAGFEVEAFAVAPKDRQLTTIEESYEDALTAYLCIGPQNPIFDATIHEETIILDNGVTYDTPKELSEYNAALTPTPIPTPAYSLGTGTTTNDCTDTVTVVGLGEANDSTSCPHDNTALFDISGIGTENDCYQRCYVESNCDFFTFSNLNGGRCMGCTSLGDASYPGLVYVGLNSDENSLIMTTEPRDICEGDCSTTTGTCVGDLVCYQRHPGTANNLATGDTVPRCSGKTTEVQAIGDSEYADYCIDQSVYSNFAMCPRPPTPNNNASAKAFSQGSLINVCVRVKDEFATQDIVLKDLLSFSWVRTGGTTFDRSIGGGDGSDTITQTAIAGSAQASNFLTSFASGSCENKYWCDFSSVLFAQFYNTDGTVEGEGDASLQFKTRRRRLGEEQEQRRLQEGPGSAGMDMSIGVIGETEGPGDLKTAGGASKATVFASVVAVVGAALLA